MNVPTGAQRIAAGIFVGFVLIVAADYNATAPIAVGFAYLILISTLMLVGPAAFENIQRMIGQTSVTPGTVAFSKAHAAPMGA